MGGLADTGVPGTASGGRKHKPAPAPSQLCPVTFPPGWAKSRNANNSYWDLTGSCKVLCGHQRGSRDPQIPLPVQSPRPRPSPGHRPQGPPGLTLLSGHLQAAARPGEPGWWARPPGPTVRSAAGHQAGAGAGLAWGTEGTWPERPDRRATPFESCHGKKQGPHPPSCVPGSLGKQAEGPRAQPTSSPQPPRGRQLSRPCPAPGDPAATSGRGGGATPRDLLMENH